MTHLPPTKLEGGTQGGRKGACILQEQLLLYYLFTAAFHKQFKQKNNNSIGHLTFSLSKFSSQFIIDDESKKLLLHSEPGVFRSFYMP